MEKEEIAGELAGSSVRMGGAAMVENVDSYMSKWKLKVSQPDVQSWITQEPKTKSWSY